MKSSLAFDLQGQIRAIVEPVNHRVDASVEHRRVRPRCDLSSALDRHALSRYRLLLHDERDELSLGAAGLDLK